MLRTCTCLWQVRHAAQEDLPRVAALLSGMPDCQQALASVETAIEAMTALVATCQGQVSWYVELTQLPVVCTSGVLVVCSWNVQYQCAQRAQLDICPADPV